MMKELEDIIKYENECTEIEFKSVQYEKSQYEKLLKDLISLANSRSKNDKYIIVGVKHYPDGKRDLNGINDKFIDEATYQQLVHENIEPDLGFSYLPFKFEGKQYGIFKIVDCLDPPYMMKKSKGNLKKGNSFIRKGSHQTMLTRKDLDLILEDKLEKGFFKGQIEVYFEEKIGENLDVNFISKENFPSEKAAMKIKEVIANKEQMQKLIPKGFIQHIERSYKFLDNGTSYENRSIDTLKENLENVKETYQEHDLYHLYEELAHKFNFILLNNGEEYLEDVSVEVRIPKKDIFIANEIYPKPRVHNQVLTVNRPSLVSIENTRYPLVIELENDYLITDSIGNLKHNIKKSGLEVPIRLAISPKIKASKIIAKIKIFGKNLKKPIEKELFINPIR